MPQHVKRWKRFPRKMSCGTPWNCTCSHANEGKLQKGNFRIELPGQLQPLQSMMHENFVTHNKELATTTTTATRMSQIYILNVQSNSSARFVWAVFFFVHFTAQSTTWMTCFAVMRMICAIFFSSNPQTAHASLIVSKRLAGRTTCNNRER